VDRCTDDSRGAPRRDFFGQILLSWGERYVRYVLRETVKVEHWTPVTWSGASLTQWKNISEHCANGSRAAPRREFFWQILLPLSSYESKAAGRVFLANFAVLVKYASFYKRRLILIILSSRFASVVRWAVPQTAKVQQRTCHYCPTRAKQLGDLWTAAPTILDVNFFGKFCCRGEVSGTWKKPKFNNAGAIIFPSWGKWCVKQSTLNTEHLWQTYHKMSSTRLLVITLVSTSGN